MLGSVTLDQWRQENGMTFTALGRALGISKSAAYRLCVQGALPDRETMRRIWRRTRGRVGAGSFYGIAR